MSSGKKKVDISTFSPITEYFLAIVMIPRENATEQKVEANTQKNLTVNFQKSGALLAPQQLAADGKTLLKYVETSVADKCKAGVGWSLHVFKPKESLPSNESLRNDGASECVQVIHLDPKKSLFRIGRHPEINHILTAHASCSAQHAIVQFCLKKSDHTAIATATPYLMDLESTHGTFLNDKCIPPARLIQLFPNDILRFGHSTREYVLLHESLLD